MTDPFSDTSSGHPSAREPLEEAIALAARLNLLFPGAAVGRWERFLFPVIHRLLDRIEDLEVQVKALE